MSFHRFLQIFLNLDGHLVLEEWLRCLLQDFVVGLLDLVNLPFVHRSKLNFTVVSFDIDLVKRDLAEVVSARLGPPNGPIVIRVEAAHSLSPWVLLTTTTDWSLIVRVPVHGLLQGGVRLHGLVVARELVFDLETTEGI